MKLYYYVHTGHRVGLDRFRRAAAIIRNLGETDITLLTSDFRIASQAKEFGVKRAVGVDVVRNIPQIAHHGDKIIFDSAEVNPTLLSDMIRFFSTFIRVSDDPEEQKQEGELLISPYVEGDEVCQATVIDPIYFEPYEKSIERAFYFGDDDYEEDLFHNLGMFEGKEMELLLGFYWFFGYEEKIASAFGKQHGNEAYDEVIRGSKVLVTASPQAALENLASGGKPIYLQRPDYSREHLPLFESLNIPVVDGYDEQVLNGLLADIASNSYQKAPQDTQKVTDFLKKNLTL